MRYSAHKMPNYWVYLHACYQSEAVLRYADEGRGICAWMSTLKVSQLNNKLQQDIGCSHISTRPAAPLPQSQEMILLFNTRKLARGSFHPRRYYSRVAEKQMNKIY